MNLAVLFGTRPEFIKLAPLILEARKRLLPVIVISTGQHREMLDNLTDWFGISPDIDLAVMTPNQSLAVLSSRLLRSLDEVFSKGKIDHLIVQGDTTTAYIGALAAYYNKISVSHLEAGLRTYNKFSPWPEEINRKMISSISDYHFAPTDRNATNLHKEGIRSNILVAGNTVIDALLYTIRRNKSENLYPGSLKEFFGGAQKNTSIILITGHRRENWGEGFESICEAIKTLAQNNPSFVIVYPVHLNPNVNGVVRKHLSSLQNIILLPPLPYPEFVALMGRSYLILTDSGGVQEEAPSLGKPVLVMRDNTERPESLETGCVKLVGTDRNSIVFHTQELIHDTKVYQKMSTAQNPYGDGTTSQKILDFLVDRING